MEPRHEPHSPDPSEPVQLAHRTTNFFIDNILRPDFGCRKEREADRDGQTTNKPTPPGTPLSECYNDTSSSSSSTISSSPSKAPGEAPARKDKQPILWPAWVYCTRYSDRPSSGKAKHCSSAPSVPLTPAKQAKRGSHFQCGVDPVTFSDDL